MDETTRLKAGALRFANKVRKQLGLPPVKRLYKGMRANAQHCPITMTILDDDLKFDHATVMTNGMSVRVFRRTQPQVVVKTTETAREFIRAFDKGHIPELDK